MSKLTYYQKTKLERYFKKSRDLAERDRIRVILNFDNGCSIDELAKILMLSRSTVCNYLDDYHKNKKSWNDPRGGSESKLTIEESQLLDQHLSENTYLKVKDICRYIESAFRKIFSRSGMNAWLKEHNFVFKKPKSIPGKVNPQQQEQFIKEYEHLKNSLKSTEIILFGDAVHPQYQSKAVCGWIKKGEEKTLQTTGKQVKMHIAGAINLEDMKIILKEYKAIDGDAMIDFCKNIENQFKASTIYLFLDNARAGKNKNLDEYLKTSRIKIKYLPPYSPNLNPIERLWKILHEKTVNNRYYKTAAEFFCEIDTFFENIQTQAKKLTSQINDNFQRIVLNPIKIACG